MFNIITNLISKHTYKIDDELKNDFSAVVL